MLREEHESAATVNTRLSAYAAEMSLELASGFLRLITSEQLSHIAGAMCVICNLVSRGTLLSSRETQ